MMQTLPLRASSISQDKDTNQFRDPRNLDWAEGPKLLSGPKRRQEASMTWMEASAGYRSALASIQVMFPTAAPFSLPRAYHKHETKENKCLISH